ncbi:phosphoglycerate mutase-like protein [Phlebopus sp. FC_14]|nr:phosphoglycerate mutase-like protein [Phlebopus sp. FC_14]
MAISTTTSTQVAFANASSSVLAMLTPTLGIYNSSATPSYLPWDTYNYCNAPHVNAEHYIEPEDTEATLVYLNVVIRHHKRTPDNLFPSERYLNPPSGWDCSDITQYDYATISEPHNAEDDMQPNASAGSAQVYHNTIIPDWHPFAAEIWPGTCDAGQLTREGLEDAVRHGRDFWSVYHHKLNFLTRVNQGEIHVRATTEVRTHQVAGAILYGMDPSTRKERWPIRTQPQNIDSLVPNYDCPKADAIRAAYQSIPAWTDHLVQHQDLQDRLDATLGTSGLTAWNSCHPLPCNATGACISQKDADEVFRLGDWEYNYIWNAAQNASTYTSLTFGVFFTELSRNLHRVKRGKHTHKLKFYVGHDGSMIRLAAGLRIGLGGGEGTLRWPAMGSEIIIEVWRDRKQAEYVRVIHEGMPVADLEWVPFQAFMDLLEAQIPENIYKACMEN